MGTPATQSAVTSRPEASSDTYNFAINDVTTSDVTTLLVNIQSGKVIYASDISTINSLINSWCQHYHFVSDEYGVHSYGNQDPDHYGNSGAYTTSFTSNPYDQYGNLVLSNSVSVISGHAISANDTNGMITSLSSVATLHKHTITDVTS
jgi:hypothetical protein